MPRKGEVPSGEQGKPGIRGRLERLFRRAEKPGPTVNMVFEARDETPEEVAGRWTSSLVNTIEKTRETGGGKVVVWGIGPAVKASVAASERRLIAEGSRVVDAKAMAEYRDRAMTGSLKPETEEIRPLRPGETPAARVMEEIREEIDDQLAEQPHMAAMFEHFDQINQQYPGTLIWRPEVQPAEVINRLVDRYISRSTEDIEPVDPTYESVMARLRDIRLEAEVMGVRHENIVPDIGKGAARRDVRAVVGFAPIKDIALKNRLQRELGADVSTSMPPREIYYAESGALVQDPPHLLTPEEILVIKQHASGRDVTGQEVSDLLVGERALWDALSADPDNIPTHQKMNQILIETIGKERRRQAAIKKQEQKIQKEVEEGTQQIEQALGKDEPPNNGGEKPTSGLTISGQRGVNVFVPEAEVPVEEHYFKDEEPGDTKQPPAGDVLGYYIRDEDTQSRDAQPERPQPDQKPPAKQNPPEVPEAEA